MTRSRRRRGGHGHGGGGGGGGGHGGGDARWLVTYADLLTLLMVLFLVLWVISTIDLKKFEQFKSGLGDFGNKAASAAPPNEPVPDPNGDLPNTTTTTISATTTTTTIAGTPGEPGSGGDGAGGPLNAEQLAGMVTDLHTAIDRSGLADVVDVHVEERGLVVSISTDNVLFASGSGTLTAAGAGILGSVAPKLAQLPNNMIIEGYTDNRPLHRTGYDNWDLSVDRAVSVLKVLRDQYGFAPSQLAATGYGDQHPIATGDDEASLARNRRVEIVIIAGPTT